MNIPPFRLRPRLFAAAIALSVLIAASARSDESIPATGPSGEAQLTVRHGQIAGVTEAGKSAPATVRELTELIMRKYPAVTINLVGVDDLVIDELTLRWPRPSRDNDSGAVGILLRALSAASGNQFSVDQGGEFAFLLTRRNSGAAARRIEVFNLRDYLEGPGDRSDLENAVRETEADLELKQQEMARKVTAVDRKELAADSLTMPKAQLAAEQSRLAMLKERLRRKNLSPKETSDRIDQLVQVVNATLQKFNPGEKMPEYEYHAGTHLLIVIGSDAAIDVTRKVVNALQQSPG